MRRIAIVDLLFRWPPDSGAYLDIAQLAGRLSKDFEVRMFVPSIDWLLPSVLKRSLNRTKFFCRGRIDRDFPFLIEQVPFSATDYTPQRVADRFRARLESFRPDFVHVANGWQMKPHLVLGLKDYSPTLRLYAHEALCLRAGTAFRDGAACYVNYLDGSALAWATCVKCAIEFHIGFPSPAYLHELVLSRALSPGYPDLVKRCLGAARAVVVASDFQAARVRPFVRQVVRVRHGVDPAVFTALAEPPLGPFRLLAAGRIDQPEKGGAVLLEAGRRLARRRRDFEILVTAEKGFSEPCFRPLRWYRHEEVAGLYRQVHAVVVPSVWPEPFAIVGLEGLMSGRPVIASEVGGMSAMISHQENGLLVPPGDPDALADAIEWLMIAPAIRRRMGAAARSHAERTFAMEVVYREDILPLFS